MALRLLLTPPNRKTNFKRVSLFYMASVWWQSNRPLEAPNSYVSSKDVEQSKSQTSLMAMKNMNLLQNYSSKRKMIRGSFFNSCQNTTLPHTRESSAKSFTSNFQLHTPTSSPNSANPPLGFLPQESAAEPTEGQPLPKTWGWWSPENFRWIRVGHWKKPPEWKPPSEWGMWNKKNYLQNIWQNPPDR